MNTERHDMRVSGLAIHIVRKDIKNLHLGVYPPHGRIRVAAPVGVSNDAVRRAVIDKLPWIRKQRVKFATQARQSQREMVSGESHFFMGQRYRLRVVKDNAPNLISLTSNTTMTMRVRPDSTRAQRERVLREWYRRELKALVPALLDKWERKLGVKTTFWGIKRMRTRWGTCNNKARRVWLNLELAKKPPHCLEYILVHELVHLIDRTHGERFLAIMDEEMPRWHLYREELNAAPLALEGWGY